MSSVKPLNYKIHLEPDLEHFTFQGKVESQVESEGADSGNLSSTFWTLRSGGAASSTRVSCGIALSRLIRIKRN